MVPRSAQFEAAFLIANGAGKSPFDMAEKFALDQPLRQGPAIDRDEGGAGPVAFIVNGIGHQLLAGAGFPENMNRVVIGGDIADLLKHLQHLGIPPDDIGKAIQVAGLQLQPQFVRDVTKQGQDADIVAGRILHHGDAHIDTAGFTGFGGDIEGVFFFVEAPGGQFAGVAEGAALAAERDAESVVAVPSQNFLPG